MKRILRWSSLFAIVFALSACAPKQPPIFKIIQLYQQEKYDDVIALAEKLTSKNPNDSEAYRFLVRSAFAKGELDKYKEKYQQLVQANPNTAGYHFALGYTYTYLDNYDDAVKEMQKALELNPSLEYAHYVLGWVYLFKTPGADREKGLAEWKKEEEIDPKSLGALQVYTDRADYNLRLGNAEAAEKDYENIAIYAFAPGDISAARQRIGQLRALRDELAKLEADVKDSPDNAQLRLQLGVLQYKNSKMKEAIQTWQKGVELDPKNVEMRNYLGKVLLESQRFADASLQFQKVIELDPKMVMAYYNLAEAENQMGKTKKAVEHYKKYIELNPMTPKLDEVKQKIATLEGQTAAKQG